ncbi:MAG: hypothetical protein M3348_17485 [Acidobacteriota bacterium]|nr:hypothetical protein [Acidobacteriota bacterium]
MRAGGGKRTNCKRAARVRRATVAPQAAADKIENPTVMSSGETKTVAGIMVEAAPMYNLLHHPS